MTTTVTTERCAMAFCPGCSHARVLEALGQAIDLLAWAPNDVCLVTDIGCIGISDRYFTCHTFHGLHGRSITYAEGIARARPGLHVVVLIGDGGAGIGTAHLVHAARRGVDLTVLVCNNFNFGMTGGQHSPTTPEHAVTRTTPGGAWERPFDVCATVAVNGASYVARHDALDAELPARLAEALAAPGFSLVELWELCVAYFVPANQLKRSSLRELSERLGMDFGVLARRPPPPTGPEVEPEADAAPEAAAAAAKAPPTAASPLLRSGRHELRVAGSAGQRVRSAIDALGGLLDAVGVHAAAQDDFPITVRKGHSVSELVLSDAPVRYLGVDHPELVVVLSDDGLRRLAALRLWEPDATCVVERHLEPPPTVGRRLRFDLTEVAREVGKPSAALAVVTAALVETGWLDPDRLLAAARNHLHGRHAEAAETALRVGCGGEILHSRAEPRRLGQ